MRHWMVTVLVLVGTAIASCNIQYSHSQQIQMPEGYALGETQQFLSTIDMPEVFGLSGEKCPSAIEAKVRLGYSAIMMNSTNDEWDGAWAKVVVYCPKDYADGSALLAFLVEDLRERLNTYQNSRGA